MLAMNQRSSAVIGEQFEQYGVAFFAVENDDALDALFERGWRALSATMHGSTAMPNPERTPESRPPDVAWCIATCSSRPSDWSQPW